MVDKKQREKAKMLEENLINFFIGSS